MLKCVPGEEAVPLQYFCPICFVLVVRGCTEYCELLARQLPAAAALDAFIADSVAAELLVGGAWGRLADEDNAGILSLYLTAFLRQIFEAGAFRAIEILGGAGDRSHAL